MTRIGIAFDTMYSTEKDFESIKSVLEGLGYEIKDDFRFLSYLFAEERVKGDGYYSIKLYMPGCVVVYGHYRHIGREEISLLISDAIRLIQEFVERNILRGQYKTDFSITFLCSPGEEKVDTLKRTIQDMCSPHFGE